MTTVIDYRSHLRGRLIKCRVPAHLQNGLIEYIAARCPVGGFLEAVLSNDLRGACRSADNVSRYHLWDLGSFLFNYAPADCWGSPEQVAAWLSDPEPPAEVFE